MKKIIFGIFAHPDDEAFGPCGTLIKEVREGAELHLFCLTRGGAGANPTGVADLGAVREREWQAAGELIGASSLYNLELQDGHLDNIAMQKITDTLLPLIRDAIASHETPVSVEFVTLDLNGLTGHIDHIVAARAASQVFYTLKAEDLPMTRIRYYCHPDTQIPADSTGWIYQEKGRTSDEISETVDARAYRTDIEAVMDCHASQHADAAYVRELKSDQLGVDHFIVKT